MAFCSSLGHLCVTKYVTPPLSTPGFNDLLRLFPNLASLEYVTNFDTFHHQFEGITPDLFEAERQSVDGVMKRQNMNYVGQWHQPMTHQQRLTASLLHAI
ncbi:hypothetical protein BY458DRAFT_446607 [Sporodiniella umbellata]|nr:hypothetical protein BY458DRAFT_446607 [Sporodiniella umbellata]